MLFQFHAEVYFDQEQQSYMLVDQGSQNGTVINGNRILQVSIKPLCPPGCVKTRRDSTILFSSHQPKTKCEPHALMHGDEVKMGETVLSFHIHSGTDTCDGCEPGQVMAHLSKHRREEKTGEELSSGCARDAAGRLGVVAELCCLSSAGSAPSKEDKEALRQKELKQMKAKYGLQVSVASSGCDPSAPCAANHALRFLSAQSNEYEDGKTLKNSKYKDRAESRRQAVGSEGVFQRDDAPASVHQ